ncbi:MAG: HEAT repeat domain-containing protein [Verrucomicrobiales bacterium]|nr:HEAT repeat domain-containing protein [Verrucomicrobiales bacterium]
MNHQSVENLRTALDDDEGFIRAIAIRALAVRDDQQSVEKIAKLAETAPEPTVRARAIEALGILKARPDVIERAKSSKVNGVSGVAKTVEGQTESDIDFAKIAREAYADGLKPEGMDLAKIGQPAPDFSVMTLDGKEFKLSSVLGKRPIAIYFSAHDG